MKYLIVGDAATGKTELANIIQAGTKEHHVVVHETKYLYLVDEDTTNYIITTREINSIPEWILAKSRVVYTAATLIDDDSDDDVF